MGIGAFILNPQQERIFELSEYIQKDKLQGQTSNNVAEYMAMIKIFEYFISKELQNEKIICYGDSMLVMRQMAGEWSCHGGIYERYYERAKELRKRFTRISFQWISRELNEIADELSKRKLLEAGIKIKVWK